MEENLHKKEMKDSGVILEIDWLSRNRATIQCFEWKIDLNDTGRSNFTFYETKINMKPSVVSATKATNLSRKK